MFTWKLAKEGEKVWWSQIQTLLMGIAKDSTDSAPTSSDWPILQIQNWNKCCLLDAFFVIPPLNASGIIITLNFTDGQNLLFHLYSPLLVHSNPYFKTNQNYKSICSLGFDPQSFFISILHVSIPNCSVNGRLKLTAWWCNRLSGKGSLGSCLPSHQAILPQCTRSKGGKSHLLRAAEK